MEKFRGTAMGETWPGGGTGAEKFLVFAGKEIITYSFETVRTKATKGPAVFSVWFDIRTQIVF